MGVAVADFDNDGWQDLLVTAVGQNRLFRNTGKGTFVDVTARAGLGNRIGFSTSALWFDYDRDGWLDLLVCNYVRWTPGHRRRSAAWTASRRRTARPKRIAARRRGSSAIAATARSTTSPRRRDCSTRRRSRWA